MRQAWLRGFVATGLLAAVLVPQSAPTADLGIEVTPAKLEVSIPAGATYNLPMTVRNSSFNTVHVQTTLSDFAVGSTGAYQFERAGSRFNSLMRWATIRPREFDLPAGNTQQVQLTIAVPADAKLSGEYAGVVFFQTRPPRVRTNAIAFSVRIAAKIYETIPGTVRLAGAVTKMVAAASPRGERYRVLFKNLGNAHVYLHGQLTVQRGTTVVDTLALASGELVERRGERVLDVTGKRLEPGSYQAVATLDYGGKTETGGEIVFVVK